MQKKTDIIITIATLQEAAPLVAKLSGAKKTGSFIRGKLRNIHILLIITGPGPLNTVASLAPVLEQTAPEMVIQTGCGGAFESTGLSLGDIVIATEAVDMQIGVESIVSKGAPDEPPFYVLETEDMKIKNRYPVDRCLVDSAFRSLGRNPLLSKIKVAKGPVGTTSTITATKTGAEMLYRRFGVLMEAMEGAGAAHVSILHGVPFLEIRSVSNMAGDRSPGRWNIGLASKNASVAVCACLDELMTTIREMRNET